MSNSMSGGIDCFSDKEQILPPKKPNLEINLNAGEWFCAWLLTLDIIKVLKQFPTVNTNWPLPLVQSDSMDSPIDFYFSMFWPSKHFYVHSYAKLGEPLSFIKFQPYLFQDCLYIKSPQD